MRDVDLPCKHFKPVGSPQGGTLSLSQSLHSIFTPAKAIDLPRKNFGSLVH